MQRRLAAIVATDVVGYSRLMEADEEGTLTRLKALRREIVEPAIAEHSGRLVKLIGDGALVEFASALDATRCALAIQEGVAERASSEPADRCIALRIGINVGDVIVDGEDIYGDGVNVAARLEGLANPGGICISGLAYDHIRNKIAARFESLGEQRLKNIAEPVRVYRIVTAREVSSGAHSAFSQAMFDRPAIAVLPFINMSGDPDQDYFSDGLAEDLIAALAAWRRFPVIARNSTFIYKGKTVSAKQIASELGARYVVEGGVRKSGGRLRITAQLTDATTGLHLWAKKIDEETKDVFLLQDEITRRIVTTIEPELERAEQRRSAKKNPQTLDAWDFYLRGIAALHEVTPEANAKARQMFEHAIDLDPTYSPAFTGLANTHHNDILLECTDDRMTSLARLFDAARRAVALDDGSSAAHEALSTGYIWADQYDLAIAEAERAVELDPNSVIARRALGNKLDLAGRSEEGIVQLEAAMRLSPQEPRNHVHMAFLARACVNARRYDDAIAWARRSIGQRPDYPHAHYILGIALGHLGRTVEARALIEACERLHPGFVKKRSGWLPYRNAADNAHLREGLRKAGVLD